MLRSIQMLNYSVPTQTQCSMQLLLSIFSASSTRERYLQRTVTKPIRIHAFVYSKIRAFNYCKCLNFIILPYAYISLLSTSIKLVSKKRCSELGISENRMDLHTNNKPDRFCRSHNLRSSELDNQKCDKKMISDLKQVKPSLVEEAVNKR